MGHTDTGHGMVMILVESDEKGLSEIVVRLAKLVLYPKKEREYNRANSNNNNKRD